MLRFCSGVNGLNHSSPWCAWGQSLSPSQKGLHPPPSYLQHSPMLDADWESLCPKLFLSQLIYIQWSDGVSAQSPSLESRLSHLILSRTHYICHYFLSLRPPTCLFASSLINSLSCALIHTHSPRLTLAPSLASLRHQVSHAI